jgi:hypothetical protein
VSHNDGTPLKAPHECPQLEPFATIFVTIVVPEAIEGGWFEAGENPLGADRQRISRRIETQIATHVGHPLHPAIWVHALLVCAHLFYEPPSAIEDAEEKERQMSAIDAAFSLMENLKLHHDLYELYLRIF